MYTHCDAHGSQKWVGHLRCKCGRIAHAYNVDEPLSFLILGTLDLITGRVNTDKAMALRELQCRDCGSQFAIVTGARIKSSGPPGPPGAHNFQLACARCYAAQEGF